MRREIPNRHDVRIVEKFLIIPRCMLLSRETRTEELRWLERARFCQWYAGVGTGWCDWYWIDDLLDGDK